MVKKGCVWMGSDDCHKYDGRRWIWYSMPPQLVITVQSAYAVNSSSTAADVVFYQLRTVQTSDTHLHPILTANCVAMRPPQPATRDCTSSNEIRFYLYTRVQRN